MQEINFPYYLQWNHVVQTHRNPYFIWGNSVFLSVALSSRETSDDKSDTGQQRWPELSFDVWCHDLLMVLFKTYFPKSLPDEFGIFQHFEICSRI